MVMIAKPIPLDHTAKHFASQGSFFHLSLVGMFFFAHVDPCVVTGTFVHTFSAKWDEIQLMKVLHQLGFEKAFILAIEPKDLAFTLVTFGESHGSLAHVEKQRPSRPWPPRHKRFPCIVQASRDMDS